MVTFTRPEVIDVRQRVTVAKVTTVARGLAVEVEIDHDSVGIDRAFVVACDGLYTIARSSLTSRVGVLDESTMGEVC